MHLRDEGAQQNDDDLQHSGDDLQRRANPTPTWLRRLHPGSSFHDRTGRPRFAGDTAGGAELFSGYQIPDSSKPSWKMAYKRIQPWGNGSDTRPLTPSVVGHERHGRPGDNGRRSRRASDVAHRDHAGPRRRRDAPGRPGLRPAPRPAPRARSRSTATAPPAYTPANYLA